MLAIPPPAREAPGGLKTETNNNRTTVECLLRVQYISNNIKYKSPPSNPRHRPTPHMDPPDLTRPRPTPADSQSLNSLQAIHGIDRTTHEPPPTSPGRARHKPIAALPCGGRARPAPHTGPAPRTKPNAAPLQGRGARPAPLTGAGTTNTGNRAPRDRHPNTI